MRSLKCIVKDILLKENKEDEEPKFDVDTAFQFLQDKEGRPKPRAYIVKLMEKEQWDKINPEVDLTDEELWREYNFYLYPERLTKEERHYDEINLYGKKLEKLPNNLKVDGFCRIDACHNLKKLSNNIQVGESLIVKNCESLSYLADNIEVADNLTLHNNPNLLRFPRNLKVAKRVFLLDMDPIPQRLGLDHQTMNNVQEVTNAIRKEIEELGGSVGGKISIWSWGRKGEKSFSYFGS